MTLHEQIVVTLQETLCRDRQFTAGPDDSLMESGYLDSLAFLELRDVLQRRFGVVVAEDEFTPENLDSTRALAEFVQRKRGLEAATL